MENLDLAYAPQFSSAKDPVIMAGFVASNIQRDDVRIITCEGVRKKIEEQGNVQIVDVRTPSEYESGHLAGAILIPLDDLRDRLDEIDPARETIVYCRIGLRGYLAARILQQNGFKNVSNLTGGILMCKSTTARAADAANLNGCATVQELNKALKSGHAVAIDVREPEEYAYEHIPETQNIPLSRLKTEMETLSKEKDLYLICQSGVRTEQAIRILSASGFQRLNSVEGGLQAWKAAGLAVQRAKGPIPIMRQVQIAAGSLALIGGSVPSFRWIAIVVGGGLLFAGVSGRCGMAALLMKMPWNRSAWRKPKECRKINSCAS